MLTVVVVFPTPPFWFDTVMTRVVPSKSRDTASSARRRDVRSASSRAIGLSSMEKGAGAVAFSDSCTADSYRFGDLSTVVEAHDAEVPLSMGGDVSRETHPVAPVQPAHVSRETPPPH